MAFVIPFGYTRFTIKQKEGKNMGGIPERPKLRQDITDFIQFEDETSLTWPWAISAEKLLQNEEMLQKIVDAVRFDENGCYDADDLYDAIGKIAGANPTL